MPWATGVINQHGSLVTLTTYERRLLGYLVFTIIKLLYMITKSLHAYFEVFKKSAMSSKNGINWPEFWEFRKTDPRTVLYTQKIPSICSIQVHRHWCILWGYQNIRHKLVLPKLKTFFIRRALLAKISFPATCYDPEHPPSPLRFNFLVKFSPTLLTKRSKWNMKIIH